MIISIYSLRLRSLSVVAVCVSLVTSTGLDGHSF